MTTTTPGTSLIWLTTPSASGHLPAEAAVSAAAAAAAVERRRRRRCVACHLAVTAIVVERGQVQRLRQQRLRQSVVAMRQSCRKSRHCRHVDPRRSAPLPMAAAARLGSYSATPPPRDVQVTFSATTPSVERTNRRRRTNDNSIVCLRRAVEDRKTRRLTLTGGVGTRRRVTKLAAGSSVARARGCSYPGNSACAVTAALMAGGLGQTDRRNERRREERKDGRKE